MREKHKNYKKTEKDSKTVGKTRWLKRREEREVRKRRREEGEVDREKTEKGEEEREEKR